MIDTKTDILNDLIDENKLLIYKLIKPFKNFASKEDLYQVAVLGLIKAKENYNALKDTSFSSYAYFYIKGELNEYARSLYTFKVNKDVINLNKTIVKAESYLEQKLERSPTLLEIANFLEIDLDKLIDIKARLSMTESLDKEQNEESYYDTNGFIEKGYNEDVLDLKNELSNLDEKSQMILKGRYEYGYSQKELSSILGISQSKVSRCEKESLAKLRKRLM